MPHGWYGWLVWVVLGAVPTVAMVVLVAGGNVQWHFEERRRRRLARVRALERELGLPHWYDGGQ